MNFTHKNVLKKIIEQSKDVSDLVKPFQLFEIGDIYSSDESFLEECEPCIANCCFFRVPHYTGIKNYFKLFEKTKVPEKLKENKSEKEIKELEKRFSEQTRMNLFDKPHLVLNSNWVRVLEMTKDYKIKNPNINYEIGDNIFMAACIMLSKDLKCMDYERRFDFCKEYPTTNWNGMCINDLKILYEFKNKN